MVTYILKVFSHIYIVRYKESYMVSRKVDVDYFTNISLKFKKNIANDVRLASCFLLSMKFTHSTTLDRLISNLGCEYISGYFKFFVDNSKFRGTRHKKDRKFRFFSKSACAILIKFCSREVSKD